MKVGTYRYNENTVTSFLHEEHLQIWLINVSLVFHTVTRVTRNREEKTRVVIQDFLLVFNMFLLCFTMNSLLCISR